MAEKSPDPSKDLSKDRKKRFRKRYIGEHRLSADTQMMSYGYSPSLSEGAVKPPIFLTSTFAFQSASEGKHLFDLVSGRVEGSKGDETGLIYSRFNNPNLEILEDRLALYEEAEQGAVFASGMAAIATLLLSLCRPKDTILCSRPLYGGTEVLLDKVLPSFDIRSHTLEDALSFEAMRRDADAALAQKRRIPMIYVESPANPTNDIVDFSALSRLADMIAEKQEMRPWLAIDNTLLGPLYQKPIAHGFDFVLYSLTKYVGGHSDLIGGAVLGSEDAMKSVRAMRNTIGSQLDAHSCWMLLRSMETLSLRMERSNQNAQKIAQFLQKHPKIASVNYLGFCKEGDHRYDVYRKQCLAAGSTMSFELHGGQADGGQSDGGQSDGGQSDGGQADGGQADGGQADGGQANAFRFLDRLSLVKLAVSLGGTESLASHPASTTHSGTAQEERKRMGIGEAMVRLSIGIEDSDDIIADLENALK